MTKDDIYLDGGDFSDLKDLIIQCDKAYSATDLYDGIPLTAMAVGNGEIDLNEFRLQIDLCDKHYKKVGHC